MVNERRNPYVVLGIPFGAGEARARTGFARARRRLREDGEARYALEDLTWALHQVEQIIEDPSKAFDVYRVPADSEATRIDRPGVFNPQAEVIPRSTPVTTDEQRNAVKARAIQQLLRDALTTESVDLAIPKPYDVKEPTND